MRKRRTYGEIMGELAYRYLVLKESLKEIKAIKRTPIDIIIDKATGHNPHTQVVKDVIVNIKEMIKLKKILKEDYTSETSLCNELNNLITKAGDAQ
jgi:hypothetical protein